MNSAPPERAVHRERGCVGAAELPVPEQPERKHRMRAPVLHDEERRDRADADDAGGDLARSEAVVAFDQRPAQCGQPDRGQHRPDRVERLL